MGLNYKYALISFALSLAVTAPAYILSSRLKSFTALFSASLGIIMFECIRNIFAECGWEYAALFGMKAGVVIQTVIFSVSFFLFRELSREYGLSRGFFSPHIISLTCFSVGKQNMRSYSLLTDAESYILGEAVQFAMISAALDILSGEFREKNRVELLARAGTVLLVKYLSSLAYYLFEVGEGSLGALVMLTMGSAGMVFAFISSIKAAGEVSAAGFVAGLTSAFCFDALMT